MLVATIISQAAIGDEVEFKKGARTCSTVLEDMNEWDTLPAQLTTGIIYDKPNSRRPIIEVETKNCADVLLEVPCDLVVSITLQQLLLM